MPLSIKRDEALAKYATFGVGGRARFFCIADSVEDLKEALSFAYERSLRVEYVAGCSNIVFGDEVDALVIKIAIAGFEINDERVTAGAGEILLNTVHRVNAEGLAGLQTLAGIPGTIGGAIVGNAGAYGREISESIESVMYFDGSTVCELTRADCEFGYRKSIFKEHRNFAVLSVVFKFTRAVVNELKNESARIEAERNIKYPPGIKCPGSFFKNIPISEIEQSILAQLPPRAVVHGKVAVGYLIESEGAKGLCVGDACVADYHGNLLLNKGEATYADVRALAEVLRKKVHQGFLVELQEEIRYIA